MCASLSCNTEPLDQHTATLLALHYRLTIINLKTNAEFSPSFLI